MLEIENVSYQTQSLKWLVRNICLVVPSGQFLCIVGPNGAGKSTLLRMISNELVPTEGSIRLRQRNLKDYDPTELAKLRAYLAQKREMAFPFRALQIVLLGRHPYLQGRKESSHDVLFAQQQLQRLRSCHLSERVYLTLSGGESTRVDMARVLSQEPELLLLDEPTNHLDPYYQLELLELCRSLVNEQKTIIAVMHDLNLVAQYADRVLLLSEGRLVLQGQPNEVFQREPLREIYGVDFDIWQNSQGRLHIMPVASAVA
jgi:iron complex transport system ATP-binding protein